MIVIYRVLLFIAAYFIGIFVGQWLFGKVDREGRLWLAAGFIMGIFIILIKT
jgi:hypothetical protein